VSFVRRHLRLANALALVAMLWLAGLPTLSQALTSATGQTRWVEVCTAQGMRLLAVSEAAAAAGEDPVPPMSTDLSVGHCSFCSLAGGALGLPPTHEQAWLGARADALPWPPSPVPRAGTPQWGSAQPRAPPACS
jgi:hypothetical protein